ncbi:MAG: hypothetical protein NDI77_17825 [Geobacteraceae bacterium]|nr:hypothetical protein [Geobacteraceae bacterium]
MTRKRLLTAGWLAMASAVMTIPWFILAFFLGGQEGLAAKAAEAVMLVTGTMLTVYLLLTLRRLLHERYRFGRADTAIGLLIKASVVSALAGMAGLAFTRMESASADFAMVMVVVIGVLQIVFGVSLLRLPDPLQGLHKPYCYLNIATGLCLALVILMPLGMLTGAVADVMLGTIFFQAASAVE